MLKYNLQFFAKEGPGGEKTEPATPKKLEDARKEGQVAKSTDLVSAVSLIITFSLLRMLIGDIGYGLMDIFKDIYSRIEILSSPLYQEQNVNTVMTVFTDMGIAALLIAAPIFIADFLIAFIMNLLQVKWKITSKPIMPKLNKLNPIKGFKKIFSLQSVVNLLKSISLVAVIGYLIFLNISELGGILLNLYEITLQDAIILTGEKVFDLSIQICVIYLIISIGDFIYQKIKFKNDNKMTKQEVKDEYKNAEGDPQIKSKIRRKMMEVSQRRMMQSLPEADVVITNPTHYAVALKYDVTTGRAPIVLAKGEDFLAQRIRKAAEEYEIEIVENKPLARAIYTNVDVGEEIPQELYQAVAEVLAFVYGLKNKL